MLERKKPSFPSANVKLWVVFLVAVVLAGGVILWVWKGEKEERAANLNISSSQPKKTSPQKTGIIPLINQKNPNTRPLDTDKDGLSDKAEKEIYKTDPYKADSDGDELSDWQEVANYKTNPLAKDSDQDGVDDFEEIKNNTNPLDKEEGNKKPTPLGF